MNKNIVLSVIGPDKPGVVSDISEIITNNSGNIDKSRMLRLGDFFTIMVLVEIDNSNLKGLENEFNNYSNYQISIYELKKKTEKSTTDEFHVIHLNGIDNEGLVYKITNELAKLDINIEELETNRENAPMSGLALFSLIAKISHPKLNYEILKEKMDALASELDVNIILD